jgi:lysophospholipase L1-like esterase
MVKKMIIMAIILGLFGAGFRLFWPAEKIKNAPVKDRGIIVFGDSLAEGVGATEGNDLPSLLGRDLDRPVWNFGRSGDTTRDALERLDEAQPDGAGLVVIILGGNDVLKKIPQEETFQNLEKIIDHFQSQGEAVILVGVRSGLVGDGRGADFAALAEKKEAFYVSDILQDVFGKREYMSDAVHPNDAGYALIGKRLAEKIRHVFAIK